MRKTCRVCLVEKDFSGFYKKTRHAIYNNNPAGFSHDCIPCSRSKAKQRRIDKGPDYQRNYDLRSKYGITIAEYEGLLLSQNNRCAICERHETELHSRLAVDHNHSTEKVRGLLCAACNTSLGKLRECPDIINNMLQYILKHS